MNQARSVAGDLLVDDSTDFADCDRGFVGSLDPVRDARNLSRYLADSIES
jgi:hypothetical protein